VSSVTGMLRTFKGARAFNQDISEWCVENIPTEPVDFTTNDVLADDNKPVWGTCPAQLPNYLPSTGLVAWYPFNGNPNDESGNGNNGTNNGASLAQDRNGENDKAYYFSGNGCSTRIDVNVDTSSIETNNSFSFSVWYRHNGNGCNGPRLLEFWPGGDTYGKFAVNTNRDGNTFSPNIDYRSSEGRMGVRWDLEPNQWTHLVYTIDQNQFKIYQNGQLLESSDYYLNSGQTSGTIKLAQDGAFGRMNHSAYDAIDGYLDDIGIWNRVLS